MDAPPWSAMVVSQEFRGPVAGIEDNMKVFAQEFTRQNVVPIGPLMAIIHKPPKSADDLIRYELAAPVAVTEKSRLDVREPLKAKELRFRQAVKQMHVGSYPDIFGLFKETSRAIFSTRKELQGPVVLRYIDNPAHVSVAERRTELVIPLKPNLLKTAADALRLARPYASTVVSQEFKGPVTGQEENMKAFTEGFFRQGFVPSGPPMAIYYEEPKDQQTPIRYALAFPVAPGAMKKAQAQEPLRVQKFNFRKVAKLKSVGPYQELFNVHRTLKESTALRSARLTRGPVAVHQFIDNPALIPAEELITEILLPVR